MKLLYCLECLDMVALRREQRSCACRLSSGFYARDEITAHVAGPCVCIGVDSADLERAVREAPQNGAGIRAFLIGQKANRVVRLAMQGMQEARDKDRAGRREREGRDG